jgi:hypothetical protein
MESHKHPAVKLLRQIPSIGPIRAALLLALLQTPHRFRTKRQLWAYSGFAGRNSRQRRVPLRSRDVASQSGTHQRPRVEDNYNRDLKNLFKSTAVSASTRPGPLRDFYIALLEKGMRPTMARLTLARKIAAITLTIWKKGVDFDAKQLDQQAA